MNYAKPANAALSVANGGSQLSRFEVSLQFCMAISSEVQLQYT